MVSTHSRPKAAALSVYEYQQSLLQFQHTAARRRLPVAVPALFYLIFVSTHSRPKAAALEFNFNFSFLVSFNTQPPEGGCDRV